MELVDLKASYNQGWQRKSSGRAYQSEKILSYGTQISNCKQRGVNKVTGYVKEHDCRVNWRGNSRVRESDLAVDMWHFQASQKRLTYQQLWMEKNEKWKNLCHTRKQKSVFDDLHMSDIST